MSVIPPHPFKLPLATSKPPTTLLPAPTSLNFSGVSHTTAPALDQIPCRFQLRLYSQAVQSTPPWSFHTKVRWRSVALLQSGARIALGRMDFYGAHALQEMDVHARNVLCVNVVGATIAKTFRQNADSPRESEPRMNGMRTGLLRKLV
ncbi:hypothetical protein FB451DRAFT_1170248 [Mycena latifolia]|nr:hypothetical protein FB451DRAFT_1170248 [Mycena latifolia]